MRLTKAALRNFLEAKYEEYHRPEFIKSDPISIPHLFTKKEDIEISGFLAATIAWGQRITIMNNARKLVKLMDMQPYDFVMNAGEEELERLSDFKHRTFNGIDAVYFLKALKNIYLHHGGLEAAFSKHPREMGKSITAFREIFFSIPYPDRTAKHVSNPAKGSAAKRLNMFLRWMVRSPQQGVDFGIWKSIRPKHLMCPLDVHSGNVARKLKLLKRKQNDWKATVELTENLRKLDADDPVKYDLALFGLGVFEGF